MIAAMAESLDLHDFYNTSEPLKCVVIITYLLHISHSITDEVALKHFKVDLEYHIEIYKAEFDELE